MIEPRKHHAIDIADGNPLWRPTPEHIELMPKGENFGLQGCARSEPPGHGGCCLEVAYWCGKS